MSVVAVQNHASPPPQPSREKPLPGPAAAQARPVATETQLAQPVALPPVVTALTADLPRAAPQPKPPGSPIVNSKGCRAAERHPTQG